MLKGLKAMSAAELVEVARMVGADPESEPEEIRQATLAWVAKRAGAASADPAAVERAALERIAKEFGLQVEPGQDVNELERSVRVKVAADAAEYLAPAWHLASALVAIGPGDAVGPKLELLEKVASLAVPSHSAREKLLADWHARCHRKECLEDLLAELKPTLAQLKQKPEKLGQALTLALVISLADGRFAIEEEKFFRDVCQELGVSPDGANAILKKVNSQFWGHQTDVGLKSQPDQNKPTDEVSAALKAAELTLSSAGTLDGLVMDARDKVIAGEEATSKLVAPKTGWRRLFGGLSGVTHYLHTRLRSDEDVNLVRLAYLCIVRQHALAERERDAADAAAQAERELRSREAELAAQRSAALDEGTVSGNPAHKRSIKLNP